ncbi:MAE_28990/MAE_18760 family HEPN-like nuclease [Stenotrophomonas maltophilia]|uniref:MAE_28990/MAE_18760 family HEPN-like nuclease n=1 Tax=Stenotrophomonas maltophilia TaxID=40324 RepID=UPI0011100445|nr:MAE_28990/MAE_18760 family HEPN-like nuclease [Stenotrophomonas maltophilia]MDZ5834586.1 MAE_28990/MAE_18760 family HEPN-like nuclease [Stenotrophomonas maltophilia]TIK64131.1 hypothetical protein E4418_19150 [Stenotrophomonas maltophilia]TIK69736.1 hypothetical protein E4416_17120 [Stenotrophomonas maltophilia]HEL4164221.1 hypothetical protein [Stenotrophomonas maltophilia]
MTDVGSNLAQGVADCLDRRRHTLTETQRVVLSLQGTVLHEHACRMAVPMLYAIWEGFAKEVLQLYIEHIQSTEIPQSETATPLLAYAWTGSFKKLANNLDHLKKVELVDRFFSALTDRLVFERREREIDTKSNLTFRVLEEITTALCLDLTVLAQHKVKLDALVNRRNNIAHGGRDQAIDETVVAEYKELVLELMIALEATLLSAIECRSYMRAEVRQTVGSACVDVQ